MEEKQVIGETRTAIGDFYVEVFTHPHESVLAGGVLVATFYVKNVGLELAKAYARNFARIHSRYTLKELEEVRVVISNIVSPILKTPHPKNKIK